MLFTILMTIFVLLVFSSYRDSYIAEQEYQERRIREIIADAIADSKED